MQGTIKSGAQDHQFLSETKTATSDTVGMIKLRSYSASSLGHILVDVDHGGSSA